MCERNGSGVWTSAFPLPSRSMATSMSVSLVVRLADPARPIHVSTSRDSFAGQVTVLRSRRMGEVRANVKPGDVLGGKYRVDRILGAGGVGVIAAGMHVELGQKCAIK